MNRAPLPPINFNALSDALLSRADQIVPVWLPGGRRVGHEWVCGGLHGGEGTSCSVNLRTGRWADFASDEKGGDLVSLYAAIHGLDQGRAAVAVAHDEGLEDVAGVQHDTSHQRPERPEPPPPTAKPARQEEGWTTVRPVPPGMPAPTFRHYSRPASDIVRTAEYRLGDELHGYVVRFRTSDGGKDDLPYTWCTSARDGAAKWHWRQFDEPRPLYLPGHSLPAGRTVILVEGERKGEVLQQLLDAQAPGIYCVVGWPGGCKAWAKADWSWIAGATVLAWPDTDSKRVPLPPKEANACADDAERDALRASKPYLPAHKQPGMAAMLGIGRLLEREHGCKVQLLAIDGPGIKPDGWDAADAIETDGWDFARVLAFFATAYALPPEVDQPTTPEPPVAKKIDGPVGTDGSDSPDSPAALPWWLECFYDADKGRWNLSRKTVILALRHDPALQGVLGYNELSNTMEARRDWPFPHGRAGKITGAVDLLLGNWLSRRYGLPSITRQAIMEAMETIAYENPWHPVREWLGGLQWDGKSRSDKWLIHAIGETAETLDPTMHEYLALVGRFWLIGMVMRVMQPGSKFDYCPVLEGPGGLFKSTMVETLAGVAWYSDAPFEIGKGKESQEQVQGIWGYELGELSQMGKAEITAIKAFISSKVDRYRPAYGRVVEEYPRQCVLVGTTNEFTYLRDRTGNRRFWPIPVRNPIRIAWLAKWRDQLFAEAFTLYAEGISCIPTREQEDRLFAPVQESRLIETAVTSELLAVLTRQPTATGIGAIVNQLTDFVTLAQLVKALDMDAGKSTAGLESQIRSWMTHQGWQHKKKQVNGVRAHGWERPADWPAPDTDMPAADAGASTEPPADDEPF
ncbi:VapE domain-containing protein [Malikia sp.]|uniref:VapE domain-containing protein n=1 Tax=Malikia sp. TaxID=2070706 RepID=UPI00263818EA|nr:VapE domain-containing protein [Malikia sp.]MDD2728308.1 VapE family protein [Malikia sp.]